MLIGYARIAPGHGDIQIQVEQLRTVGCERVFTDRTIGEGLRQVGLDAAMSELVAGDTLVVLRLDRLGFTVRGLVPLVGTLQSRGVYLASLEDEINTATDEDRRAVSKVVAALADIDRNLVAEKARVGLDVAISRGQITGRPPKLSDQQLAYARRLLADPETTGSEVARSFGVARSTLYRALQRSRR